LRQGVARHSSRFIQEMKFGGKLECLVAGTCPVQFLRVFVGLVRDDVIPFGCQVVLCTK